MNAPLIKIFEFDILNDRVEEEPEGVVVVFQGPGTSNGVVDKPRAETDPRGHFFEISGAGVLTELDRRLAPRPEVLQV